MLPLIGNPEYNKWNKIGSGKSSSMWYHLAVPVYCTNVFVCLLAETDLFKLTFNLFHMILGASRFSYLYIYMYSRKNILGFKDHPTSSIFQQTDNISVVKVLY